jgi:hypothetical protein
MDAIVITPEQDQARDALQTVMTPDPEQRRLELQMAMHTAARELRDKMERDNGQQY